MATLSRWQRVRAFYAAHSILGNFLILAPSMVIILLVSIQTTQMEVTQRLTIVLATIGLAAACAWVINLSDEPDEDTAAH